MKEAASVGSLTRRNAILGASLALTAGSTETAAATPSNKTGGDPKTTSRIRLICVEEHTADPRIEAVVKPVMEAEAPYFKYKNLSSDSGGYGARDPHRPTPIHRSDVPPLLHDLGEGRIRHMDEQGIDMQVVSCLSSVHLAPIADAPALARAENERLATAIAAYPKRLQAFAILPWQDAGAAVAELNRAVLELGLKGVLIAGRPGEGNIFLDDHRYEPILRRLRDLKVPLYVHPNWPAPDAQKAYYSGFAPELTAQFSCPAWGWHHEAGLQVLRMIFAGVFERLPDLQIISGHWGEMVPFYLSRLDDWAPKAATVLSRTVTETYRSNVWITPSGIFDLPSLSSSTRSWARIVCSGPTIIRS